jgi:hypothetical protein
MPITFSSQDINLTSFPHTDTMVITVHVDRWEVAKIHIDNGSQGEILFLATFNKMGFDQKQLNKLSKPLYGFGGKESSPSELSHSQYPSALPITPTLNTSPSMWLTWHTRIMPSSKEASKHIRSCFALGIPVSYSIIYFWSYNRLRQSSRSQKYREGLRTRTQGRALLARAARAA